MKLKAILLFSILSSSLIQAQTENTSLTYHVELGATAGGGTYAPLWFTGNRYGLGSTNPNSGYLLAGVTYGKQFQHGWRIEAGLDMAGGIHQAQDVFIHQIYGDFSWKMLTLSIGSKERPGFPLTKNTALSSGMLVEGPNTQPVPQIRGEIKEYLNVPGTKEWLAFKGHIAYGSFAENGWQKKYVQPGQYFVKDVLYHSKSLMLRLGNKDKFPLEFEVGILMATQFGGDKYLKLEDGSTEKVLDMPENLKAVAQRDQRVIGLLCEKSIVKSAAIAESAAFGIKGEPRHQHERSIVVRNWLVCDRLRNAIGAGRDLIRIVQP